MAVESKRGCGFRRAGGAYLVSEGLGEPCERLPIPLDCCPTCGQGIKQTRSAQWVKTDAIFAGAKACAFRPDHCPRCAICQPVLMERHADPKDKVLLMWVGEKYYPTTESWTAEAARMGVSKRISAIPKGLVLGKTWILVAHPKAIAKTVEKPAAAGELHGHDEIEYSPGIFHAFVPKRVELIVTPSMKEEDWVKKLVEKQGVTLVEVPEDDPDHAPKAAKKSARRQSMDRAAERMSAKEEAALAEDDE